MLRTDASRENLRIAPAAAARDGGKDSQSRAELSVSPVRCLVGLQRDGKWGWEGGKRKKGGAGVGVGVQKGKSGQPSPVHCQCCSSASQPASN